MATAPARIVVGVDGTIYGDAALAFALDEADRRGDLLEVITAWDPDAVLTSLDPAYGVLVSRTECTAESQAEQAQFIALERALAGRRRPPPIRARVVRGDAGKVLVAAGRGSRLLVVGSRPGNGERAASRSSGGSVSHYCACNFSGPLTIVPPAA